MTYEELLKLLEPHWQTQGKDEEEGMIPDRRLFNVDCGGYDTEQRIMLEFNRDGMFLVAFKEKPEGCFQLEDEPFLELELQIKDVIRTPANPELPEAQAPSPEVRSEGDNAGRPQ